MLLENRRKAATMLVALGPERAAEILRTLDEDQVTTLLAEVSTIGSVTPAEAADVLREAAQQILDRRNTKEGGPGFAREVLHLTVGPDRASQMSGALDPDRAHPFAYLANGDPEVVASALTPEPPPSIALALANLDPSSATPILMKLPDEIRSDVALRMATLNRTHPDVITELDNDFRTRITPLLVTEVTEVEGMKNLVQILNKSPKPASSALLDEIEQRDPELAAQIRDALFVFDDIVILDDAAVQQVLKTVDTRDLAIALKESTDTIKDRIFSNLSSRARENLEEEIEFLRNIKKSDIEDAQKKVVRVVRQLEDAGTIIIDRGDD